MTTYEKVKKFADKQGMPIYKVEQAAGISNGTIGGWKEGKPLFETACKVAAALGVSVVDLIGEE